MSLSAKPVTLTALTAELVAPPPLGKEYAVTVVIDRIGSVIYVKLSTENVDLGLLERDAGHFFWVLKHQGKEFHRRQAPMIVGSLNESLYEEMKARYGHGSHDAYQAWQYPQRTLLNWQGTIDRLIEWIHPEASPRGAFRSSGGSRERKA